MKDNVLTYRAMNQRPQRKPLSQQTLFYTVDQVPSLRDLTVFAEMRQASLGKLNLTVFIPPNRTGPLPKPLLEATREWLTIGMYGWEGTPYECRAWSDEQAMGFLNRGLEYGYAPIFMAPWHIWDTDLVGPLNQLGLALVHRAEQDVRDVLHAYPGPFEKRTHFPAHGHVYSTFLALPEHPMFIPERLQGVTRFLSPRDLGLIGGGDVTRLA